VADTENRISLSHCNSRLAKVDFPAPDGDDKIINNPRRVIA